MQNDSKSPLSPHILPTSANLLGICFLIFSLVHSQDKAELTLLDDCAVIAILVFLAAGFFSYLGIRSPNRYRLERLADITFLFGLCTLATAATLMALKLIK